MRSKPSDGRGSRRSKSLIVVTSNFHMPRALAEISHQLPDVRLVAFPVVSDRVKIEFLVVESRDGEAPFFGVSEVYGRARSACGSTESPEPAQTDR